MEFSLFGSLSTHQKMPFYVAKVRLQQCKRASIKFERRFDFTI